MSQKIKMKLIVVLNFPEVFGSFLLDLFIREIGKGKERYFYMGMTGDSYYPSARSALHRLAGPL